MLSHFTSKSQLYICFVYFLHPVYDQEKHRNELLFIMLTHVFEKCGVALSSLAFLFCASYTKKRLVRWKLLNFVMGQAKLSIYKRRKNKINNIAEKRVDTTFIQLVKYRCLQALQGPDIHTRTLYCHCSFKFKMSQYVDLTFLRNKNQEKNKDKNL